MDDSLLNGYFDSLQKMFNFDFVIHNDSDNSLLRIVITNLVLNDQELNLNHEPLYRSSAKELFIHIDVLVMQNSKIVLPKHLHQLSINQAIINSSSFEIDKESLIGKGKIKNAENYFNSIIIGIEYSQIDSLSAFDNIPNDLILQITDCELIQLHKSNRLPPSLVMLTFRDSSLKKMGIFRTNEKLQLISLEIGSTPDTEFILEIHTQKLLKLRVSGPRGNPILGSLRFFKPMENLYFIDLQDLKLHLTYNLNYELMDLLVKLKYLRLPKQTVQISDKMKAFMKMNGIDVNKLTS